MQSYTAMPAAQTDPLAPMITHPKSPVELLDAAQGCLRRRQFARARQLLAQLVQCQPQNVQAWMLLARLGILTVQQEVLHPDQPTPTAESCAQPVAIEPSPAPRHKRPARVRPWALYVLAGCASMSMWLMLIAIVSLAPGPPVYAHEQRSVAPVVATPTKPPAPPVAIPTIVPEATRVPLLPSPAPFLVG